MNMINSVIVAGNVKGAELKQTAHGSLLSFNIDCVRKYKKPDGNGVLAVYDETSTFDIEAWGKLAERVALDLTEGRGVRVVGRLKQNRWSDAGGNEHTAVVIVAEHIELKPKPVTHSQVEG